MYGAAAAVAMIGFAYASVPLYRMVCAATGYGGAVQTGHTVEEKMRRRQEQPDEKMEKAAAEREITVWFNGDVAENMPWSFSPTQESVRVRPGQSALAFFTAKNDSDRPVTGYSVYNVTPEKAALYFNKIQCFCFEEQRLRAQEEVDMPVLFYIDPEMAVDWNCRNVSNITLSYTFHKVDSDEEEEEELQIPSGIKLHGPGTHPPLTAPGATAAAAAAAGGGCRVAGAALASMLDGTSLERMSCLYSVQVSSSSMRPMPRGLPSCGWLVMWPCGLPSCDWVVMWLGAPISWMVSSPSGAAAGWDGEVGYEVSSAWCTGAVLDVTAPVPLLLTDASAYLSCSAAREGDSMNTSGVDDARLSRDSRGGLLTVLRAPAAKSPGPSTDSPFGRCMGGHSSCWSLARVS